MPRKPGKRPLVRKVVDETIVLKRPRRGACLREEVWQGEDGSVVKYNLAYINHLVCPVDNGRVLGYDNNHGSHHRHLMGSVEVIEFRNYESLVTNFLEEVRRQWRREDEESD